MKFALPAALCALLLLFSYSAQSAERKAPPVESDGRPRVEKNGTVGLDLCETSPFAFKGKLYRLDWHRKAGRLRVIEHDTRREVCHFADKHAFQSVVVDGDTVHVIATLGGEKAAGRFRNTLNHFVSNDLKTWEMTEIFHDSKFVVCNTSLCKGDGKWVMSVEVRGDSPGALGPWSARFMESKDLTTWTMLPEECRNGIRGRIYSPHLLRFHDGWYYLFATVTGHPKGYTLDLRRSRDFKTWEASPFNPIMVPDERDKIPFNPDFTDADKAHIDGAKNRDNSDIDFCEFGGKLVITYCWGNQVGTEFVSEAFYSGTEAQYLEGWFPKMKQ